MTLRLAVTVVEELPNGVLRIEGQQEVRVNNELRELRISGYVRPDDISRQNEITYDKIAEAQISYGGRGLITDAQQPRYGQQLVDQLARSEGHDQEACPASARFVGLGIGDRRRHLPAARAARTC